MIGIPRRLLTALFGAGPLRDVAKRARADLPERSLAGRNFAGPIEPPPPRRTI